MAINPSSPYSPYRNLNMAVPTVIVAVDKEIELASHAAWMIPRFFERNGGFTALQSCFEVIAFLLFELNLDRTPKRL